MRCTLTLEPPHLSGRSVALLVSGSDAEYDSRFVRCVHVRAYEMILADGASWCLSEIDSHKGQLARICAGWVPFTVGTNSEIYRVLLDFPSRVLRRLPRQLGSVRTLVDLDVGWRSRKSGKTRLESRDLTERTPPQ